MKLRAMYQSAAALALIPILAACDGAAPTGHLDAVPPQAVQRPADALLDPQRYFRLTDLASAIRKAGHPCEVVKSYKKIAQSVKGGSIYKVDCLEYSFRLTMLNGQSQLERFIVDDK